MADAPIVLMHSMFPPRITKEDVREALPASQRELAIDWIEIRPDYQPREHYDHGYDYFQAAEEQERQVRRELDPLLEKNPRRPIAYFGFAPVPLAFQLGTTIPEGYRIQVYQRHHREHHWRWLAEDSEQRQDLTKSPGKPPGDQSYRGDLVLRVGTSHPVDPQDPRTLFEGRNVTTQDFELRVHEPNEDCFAAQAELESFCSTFDDLVDALGRGYPAARTLHLFASVPCGVAFRMGSFFNPSVRMPTHTYKYRRDRAPRYEFALSLGRFDQARILLLTADPRGWTPTSGLSEIKAIRDLVAPHRSRIEITDEAGLVATDLQRLLKCQARILHFAGHGRGSTTGAAVSEESREYSCPEVPEAGELLLLGHGGLRVGVRHDDLVDIVKSGRPEALRCAVLSACHSDELAERLVCEAGVEHAVGFRGAIDDKAAYHFSAAFYRALIDRRSPAAAVEEGKRAIEFAGRPGREQVRYYSVTTPDRSPLLP